MKSRWTSKSLYMKCWNHGYQQIMNGIPKGGRSIPNGVNIIM